MSKDESNGYLFRAILKASMRKKKYFELVEKLTEAIKVTAKKLNELDSK